MAEARKGSDAARAPLLSLLATNESPYWKAVAADLLEQWAGEPKVRVALVGLLQHENPLVRAKAAQSLAPLAEARVPDVEATLRELLRDPIRAVRFQAGWALRAIIEPESEVGREVQHILDCNADQPAGQTQKAVWHLARGQIDRALAHYAKAIEWERNAALLRLDYAVALSQAGRAGEALAQLQEACQLAPKDAESHFRLGLAWNEAGDLTQAIAALERAAQLDPRHDRALYNLGLAYQAQGETDRAIETLTRAETVNARDPRIPYALGTVFARLGRTEEAQAAAARSLEIQPGFHDAEELLRALSK
jgi:tetratricopeptide (TPR) repeat protein